MKNKKDLTYNQTTVPKQVVKDIAKIIKATSKMAADRAVFLLERGKAFDTPTNQLRAALDMIDAEKEIYDKENETKH